MASALVSTFFVTSFSSAEDRPGVDPRRLRYPSAKQSKQNVESLCWVACLCSHGCYILTANCVGTKLLRVTEAAERFVLKDRSNRLKKSDVVTPRVRMPVVASRLHVSTRALQQGGQNTKNSQLYFEHQKDAPATIRSSWIVELNCETLGAQRGAVVHLQTRQTCPAASPLSAQFA